MATKKVSSRPINEAKIRKFVACLKSITKGMDEPMGTRLAREYKYDPFVVLISCLLSLRSRDVVTYGVAHVLFSRIRTPQELIDLPMPELHKIIRSIGFYRRKAEIIKEVSRQLIERFKGVVPQGEEDLLSLPGVGQKTASLVRAEAFGIPALAVDTHVHRLANQLGLVHTKTAEQTAKALLILVPRDLWIPFHRLLVTCGQKKCALDTCSPLLK